MTAGAHKCRRTIERRAAASMKTKRRKRNKTKQNKRHTRESRHSIYEPPERHDSAPLVTNQLWRANQHDPACFGLSCPWSFPSRSGKLHCAVVQPCLSLAMKPFPPCSAVLRHSPSSWAVVVHCSALIPTGLKSFRKDSTVFFLPLHQFSKHHALRQSRALHARHKSRE